MIKPNKTLTLDKIIKIVEEDYKFKVSTKDSPCLGEIDPEHNIFYLYKHNINSELEYDRTIVHELLHAIYPNIPEKCIEQHAKYIVEYDKGMVDFIKQVFEIPKYNTNKE